MTPRPLPLVVAALIAVSILVGIAIALVAADAGGAFFFVAFAGTGGYLVVKRPRNSVGWFLVLAGWGLLLGTAQLIMSPETLRSGGLTLSEAAMAWSNGCGWSLALIGFLGITLVFPTGSLPDGRGRWPSRITLGASVVLTALVALGPLINVTPRATGLSEDVPNPFAVAPDAAFWSFVPPTVLYILLFVLVIAGVVALVIRARRAVGMERLQYRWLIAAIAGLLVASIIWAIQTVIVRADARGPVDLLILVSYVAVPLSILIAIMRYRLFEIDRIISRTIAYSAVVVVLAAVFGAGVVIVSSALASVAQQAESIAVAASTLLTYAALQPVLRGVRRVVDRRFDRTRYDAERTVEAFAVRLRHETNVESVTDDLTATTQVVVAPRATSLWLRSNATVR